MKEEKENRIIIPCPKCGQLLSLPKTSSKLLITCPHPDCRKEFYYPPEKVKPKKKWFIRRNKGELRWYQGNWFTTLMLLFLFPIGIILLWNNPRYRLQLKIGLTIAFGLVFLGNFTRHPYNIPDIAKELYRERNKSYSPIHLPKSSIKDVLYKISFVEGTTEEVKTIPEIIKNVKNSIVIIHTKNKKEGISGEGTGFIISKEGIIATNYHVLAGAYNAEVKLADGRKYNKISLVTANSDKDIAVIKIDARGLPVLALGDSEKVAVGEEVVTIGNPLGLEMTTSTGIISALREERGSKYIQITAPVSPGSSGGPLLNKKGSVIGIVTSQVPPIFGQNLNFAIPINYLIDLLSKKVND